MRRTPALLRLRARPVRDMPKDAAAVGAFPLLRRIQRRAENAPPARQVRRRPRRAAPARRFLALSCKDLPKPDAIVPVPLALHAAARARIQSVPGTGPPPVRCPRRAARARSAAPPAPHPASGGPERSRTRRQPQERVPFPPGSPGQAHPAWSTTPTRPAQPCAAPPSPCSIHMPGPPPWMWPSSPEHRAKSTTSSTTGAPHTSHSPKTAENSDCGGLSCSDVP